MATKFAVTLIATFAGTGVLSASLVAGVRRIVISRGWTSHPSPTRWNTNPTPLFGGVAVFLSFGAASLLLRFWNSPEFRTIYLASICIFIVGLVDDVFDLRPRTKLLTQCAAAAWVIHSGLVISLTGNNVFDAIVTFVWLVGITNSFNLIDNMNGLCAGIAFTTAVIRGLLFLQTGNILGAALCTAMAGAVLGFLFFNFPRASIFMGDSGSLFLGFWLGAIALTSFRSFANNYLALLLFPVLAMLVPISDTMLVTFTRTIQGRPVSIGGRDHFSHRLVAYGLSETKSVLVLWAISALSGGLAVLMSVSGVSTWFTVSVLFILGAATLAAYLTRFEPHVEDGIAVPARLHSWLYVPLDGVLAAVSLYSAFVIRFGSAQHKLSPRLLVAIAMVSLSKIVVLTIFRIYRQRMRYFGLEDALRLAGASALASGACLLFAAMAPEAQLPASVIVIDFLLFSGLAVSFRSSFRVLDHLAPDKPLRRAIVHGHHKHSEPALRLLQSEYRVIGFLQSADAGIGQSIRSVPVMGSVADIAHIVATQLVDVVITTSTNDKELRALRKACNACRVPLYRLRLDLELISDAEELVTTKRRTKGRGRPAAA